MFQCSPVPIHTQSPVFMSIFGVSAAAKATAVKSSRFLLHTIETMRQDPINDSPSKLNTPPTRNLKRYDVITMSSARNLFFSLYKWACFHHTHFIFSTNH